MLHAAVQMQVLKQSGEWILASPVEGTLVVNIGDYLMRITNGRWLSTVHRVALNMTYRDRISMPFFFGANVFFFSSEFGSRA